MDDSPLVVRLLVITLEEAGFEVATASDGQAGLARVRDFSPQVLLVDALMPILDGYQLCAAVRADPALVQPYTIMLTATSDEGHQGAAEQAGIDEFMTKPFDPAAVVARVQKRLDRPA